MAARKQFSDPQIFLMEEAFRNGLKSTSLNLFSSQYRELSCKTGLSVAELQRWINNRSRKEKQRNPVDHDDSPNVQHEKTYKKRPLHKPASGYMLFCGEMFKERKEDFKNLTQKDKNLRCSDLWRQLEEEDKDTYKKQAKAMASKTINVDELSEKEVKSCICQSINRIQEEMNYLEQFGCSGYSLILNKTTKKILSASTTKGDDYILENNELGRKFMQFLDMPSEHVFSSDDLRKALNQKYCDFTNSQKRVEYEKFGKTFAVEGWPQDIPFKQPSGFSQQRIDKIMGAVNNIRFVALHSVEPLKKRALMAPDFSIATETDPQEAEATTESITDSVAADVDASTPPQIRGKISKARKGSFVKKGDIVAVLSPEKEDGGEAFYLFFCQGKVKTDGKIRGRWLHKSTEKEYILGREVDTIPEQSVLVRDNERLVLSEGNFEIIEGNYHKLTESAFYMLMSLVKNQVPLLL